MLDLIAYARQHLPETVAVLNPSDEAFKTMAQAAVQQALAQAAPQQLPAP